MMSGVRGADSESAVQWGRRKCQMCMENRLTFREGKAEQQCRACTCDRDGVPSGPGSPFYISYCNVEYLPLYRVS